MPSKKAAAPKAAKTGKPMTAAQKKAARAKAAADRKTAAAAAEAQKKTAGAIKEGLDKAASVEPKVVNVKQSKTAKNAKVRQPDNAGEFDEDVMDGVPYSDEMTVVNVDPETGEEVTDEIVDEGDVQAMTVSKPSRDAKVVATPEKMAEIARNHSALNDKGRTPHSAPLTAVKKNGEILDTRGTRIVPVRQAKHEGDNAFHVYGPTGNLIRTYDVYTHGDMAEAYAEQFSQKVNGHYQGFVLSADDLDFLEAREGTVIDRTDLNTVAGRKAAGASLDLDKNPDGTRREGSGRPLAMFNAEEALEQDRANLRTAASQLDRQRADHTMTKAAEQRAGNRRLSNASPDARVRASGRAA